MKYWQIALLSQILAGCAHISENVELTPSQQELTSSCVDVLACRDEHQSPYTYQQAFLACHMAMGDKVLVRRYVNSLILTGQFQEIKSGAAFPENVTPALAEHWQHWAKENL